VALPSNFCIIESREEVKVGSVARLPLAERLNCLQLSLNRQRWLRHGRPRDG
jgi:hypothetical protein